MIFNKILNRLNNVGYLMISFLYKAYDKKNINKFSTGPLKHQPVFIIGAPRTGSTILYQAITNKYEILYIDNLVAKWYRNLFYGFKKSFKKYGNKPHNVYRSVHGDTTMYGGHAPSECGEFWYRWFPKDRHFLTQDDIDDVKLEEIHKNIKSVINYYDKPILFKNLNAGQRLRVLVKIFPEAKFIWIRRNYLDTCYSILMSKRKLGLKVNDFWSIMPPNVEELRRMDGYKQIVLQVFNIEKQIKLDRQLFPESNFLELNYDDFIENNSKVLEEIRQFIGSDLNLRSNADEIEIKENNHKALNSDQKKLLKIIKDLKLEHEFI